jgi:SAM-dependent methyltransferase
VVPAACQHRSVPEPLADALASLRPLLLDADALVKAVAAGRRRGAHPMHARAELRPVELGAGRRLQVVTSGDRGPVTRNVELGPPAEQAVDALLAEPFGSWHVETGDRVVQLRVTKRGEAQVHTAAGSGPVAPAGHDRVRQHLLDPGDPLFGALGADAAKRRQVDAFLRQLALVVRPAVARAATDGRPLHVVDLGCGNAYLTFAAHRYLAGLPELAEHGVVTAGVDVRPAMAERNAGLAADLGLDGLRFVAGTIAEAEVGLDPVDVALALHACDTATDEALARAVRWNAPAVLAAPCCHHHVQAQLDAARGSGNAPPHPYGALTRHSILKERFADVLTDVMRADLLRLLGYRVEVVEFVDSRHTPRNALLRGVHTGAPPSPRRVAEYADLVTSWHVTPRLGELLAPELERVLVTAGPRDAG